MIGWILLGGYIVGFFWTWRTAAWVFANDMAYSRMDGESMAFGLIFGGFASLAWPVVAPCYILYKSDFNGVPLLMRFMRVPANQRRTMELEARERAVRERENRIRQLERETGVAV